MKKIYHIALCLLLSYTAFSQTISSNAPLCGNQNLTLELAATGGSTYAWKGPNGFASTQQKPTIKNVNWKNRGVYTVLVDNKTTLTTDVNIKDPVAFTVPKEISVCEGGTLLIEPKSGRLTDSTEVLQYTSIYSPSGDFVGDGIIENFTDKNIGVYTIKGEGASDNGTSNFFGCQTTKSINVKINTNCPTIEIADLGQRRLCYGQDISIPFTIKGNFKKGTKFKIYAIDVNDFFPSNKQPNVITETSPAIIKLKDDFASFMRVVIIADDTEHTFAISKPIDYSYPSSIKNNYVEITNQFCDSVSLKIGSKYSINSFQWFLDGKEIKNANSEVFISKISGSYSFKFRDNFNSSCLYESQPVKIELGKIEKPSAYVSNDIELCVGKPATLTVSTKLNTNYRWKKDGVFIANANKATFETLQEGKYQIEAKEGTCTAVSDTVILKKPVRLPEIYFEIRSNTPIQGYQDVYTICNNQEFYLGSDVVGFAKKQLFKNLQLIKETIDRNGFNFSPIKGEGVYFLKTIYGDCEAISRQITVKYDKKVKAYSFNNKDQECNGSTINLSLSTNLLTNKPEKGNIYKDGKIFKDWTINSLSSPFHYYDVNRMPINESGNYYALGKVILADKSECDIVTDTVKIIFSNKLNDISFQFDPKIQAIPIITCKDTATVNVYTYAGTKGRETSYKWTKDGVILKQDSSSILKITQAGNYQLETTYKGDCKVLSLPYRVTLGKLEVGFTHDLNETICNGNLYYLEPTLNEMSIVDIWDFYKDGKLLTSNVKNIYSISLTQSGTYKLTVKNGKCEGTSPDFVLKVDKIPTTISPTDSVVYCGNKTVDLKVSTEAGLSYIWERNGSVISQANQPTLSASTDGLYRATLLRGSCWGSTPSVKLKSLPNIIPTATLTGDQKIDYDKETKLSINLSSYAPWTFKLSDGKEYTATKSPFEIAVKPLSTTTYSLSEVKNICGTGTVSGTAKIEIIILSAEEEKELYVEVFPVPSSEICNWKIQTPAISTASVVLYDVSGVMQYIHTPNTHSQSHEGTIDLSTLKAGTYFLKLQAGEKSVTRKVVKF